MIDSLQKLLRLIISLFGANVAQDRDWDSIAPELMTPREKLLRRLSLTLLAGALVNCAAGLLLVVLAVGAARGSQPTFADLQSALLGALVINADSAALLIIAGVFGNMALLLAQAVTIRAGELWTVVFGWLLLALNLLALLVYGFAPAVLAMAPLVLSSLWTLTDIRAFRMNPVMVKEVRGRMRGIRGFAIITVFLTLMSFFTMMLYLLRVPQGGVVVTGELGRLLFIGVLFIELMLIIFIVPALTAGAITSERERKTYDLLQMTLVSKSTFVVGKLQSALGYIALLLLSAIPLQSIAFLFGGVSEAELLLALIALAVSALALGAFGMFFSSITERTLAATIRTYTVALAITVGLPIVALILFQGAYGNAVNNVAPQVSADPATEAATIYLDMIAASLNPITATIYSQQMLIDHQQLISMRVTLGSTGSTIPVLSPWVLLTCVYVSVAAVLVFIAVRRMERQGG